MNHWFRVSCNTLDGPQMARAVGGGGELARTLWLLARGYSTRHDTDGAIPRELACQLTSAPRRKVDRAIEALVAAGLWSITGDGWQDDLYPLEHQATPSGDPEEDSARERRRSLAAARQRTLRARRAAQADTPPPSSVTPGNSVTERDGNAPPSVTERDGNALRGEQEQGTETQSLPHKTEKDIQRGGEARAPESVTAERDGNAPPSVTAPSAASVTNLAEAYAAGVSKATGAPCTPATEPWNLKALEQGVKTHGAGQTREERLAWLAADAARFVALAKGSSSPKALQPEAWLAWRNAGAPAAPPGRPGVVTQPPAPPGRGRPEVKLKPKTPSASGERPAAE